MNKFYVTTSIPYVNADPHVGHAMEFMQADVLARYHRQQGDDVVFATGTDEHGGKNAEAAKALGVSPQVHVDTLSENFKALCGALDINYDRFIRTTSKQHEVGAQAIWKKLQAYIYKGEYRGMYDQKEEEFVTHEKAKELKTHDPQTYKRLQEITEENYFFKLSAFTDEIKKAITDGSFRVVPVSRKHEILAVLDKGLDDISISRPKDKLDWGITVPGDEKHVMYVWFEALMNYITVLAYPKPDDIKRYWPADVQVIGKDILRFHAAIWPGMLLAMNLPLPKTLYVHGFVTLEGMKMSKSLGNVVAPKAILDTFGSDAMRYYFLRHIPSYDDGDFSWERMYDVYNGELGNELGNLVQRLAAMIAKYLNGKLGDLSAGEHDTGPYRAALDEFRFDKALEYVFGLIRGLNQYIDEEKPWEIVKTDGSHLQEVLTYTASSLVQIAGLLEPFMPKTADSIRSIFSTSNVNVPAQSLFPRLESPLKGNL